jgi:hypothetical protein
MAVGNHTSPDKVINGTFGELYATAGDGLGESGQTYLGQIQEVEFRIMKAKREIYLSGNRHTFHKLMAVSGEGTIRGLKVNSNFLRVVGGVLLPPGKEGRTLQNPNREHFANVDFKTDLRVVLDDPEALGAENIWLVNVKLWEVKGGWRVNEILEDDVQFTFEHWAPINLISGDSFADDYPTRYAAQRNTTV